MTDPNARIGAYADATGRELPDGTDTFQHLQKPDLHGLHDEICRTFGAIHCPSLDQLDALLRKYGWTPDERGRLT